MRFKHRKWASPFFIVSLAIASIFGASAAVINKQVEETPVVEKAEGLTYTHWTLYRSVQGNLSLAENPDNANEAYATNFYLSTSDKVKVFESANNWWYGAKKLKNGTDGWDYFSGDYGSDSDLTPKNSGYYKVYFDETKRGYVGDDSSKRAIYMVPMESVTITYKKSLNGVAGATIKTASTTNGITSYTASCTPTSQSGYKATTGKYYTDVECNTEYTSRCIGAPMTLYMKYTPIDYTLSYTLNGGTASNPSNYNIETSTFTLNNPSKTGYTFTGWSGSGTGTTVTISNGSTGNKSFTANYSKDTFTIAFDKNGGTGTTESVTATYDEDCDLPANAFSRSGHRFIGWATSASGAKVYDDEDTILASTIDDYYTAAGGKGGTYTLYAKWEEIPTFTVSFAIATGHTSWGELSSLSIENVPTGSSITVNNNEVTINGIKVTATPAASDAQYTYTFDSWSNTSGTVTTNRTITADFTRTVNTYTITWYDGDGNDLETDEDVEYGTTPSYDSGITPTKTATAQYTYTWNGGWTPTPSSVTGDANYTATFNQTVNTYTVTWKNYENTVLETDNNVSYGTTASYDGSTPRRSPTATKTYTFKGWTDGVNHYTSTLPTVTGNIVLTAEFDEESITPESLGWFGGETYFFVDQINKWGIASGGDGALLRIRFWDDNDHDCLSEDYLPNYVYSTEGRYRTYRITIPEYDGTSNKGWTHLIVLRYNPTYASDTTVNWDHVWTQSIDYGFAELKSSSEWWAYSTSGGPYYDNILLSGAGNVDLYGMTSGTVRYFELGTWNKQGYTGNMAVHFFGAIGDGNSSYTADIIFDTSNQVLGTGTDYTSGLWEFTVPYANTGSGTKEVTWHSYVIVQLKAGQTQIDWNNYQFKSIDLNFTNVHTVIKGADTMDYSLADATRLGYFITYFNDQIQGACDYYGGTTPSDLVSAWNRASSQLPLEERIANEFKVSTASPVGDSVQQAAARYDYVLRKYETSLSLSDFAGRKSGGNYSYGAIGTYKPFELIIGGNDDNLSIIIIVIASSISLLSITALSVLMVKKRKRKEY